MKLTYQDIYDIVLEELAGSLMSEEARKLYAANIARKITRIEK